MILLSKANIIQQLKEVGIVPVYRGAQVNSICDVMEAFLKADIDVIEITIESPEGIDSIKKIKSTYQNRVLVGAGTVLTIEQTKEVIKAGADFIVTPILNKEIIKCANENGVFIASGAFTPTEIYDAFQAGADLIKIFPAGSLGPNYLKDLKGPLAFIPIMPTGGINEQNIQQFLQAGAVCVGIGSALYKFETMEEITEASNKFKQLTIIAS